MKDTRASEPNPNRQGQSRAEGEGDVRDALKPGTPLNLDAGNAHARSMLRIMRTILLFLRRILRFCYARGGLAVFGRGLAGEFEGAPHGEPPLEVR